MLHSLMIIWQWVQSYKIFLLSSVTIKILNNVTKYLIGLLQDFKNKIYKLNWLQFNIIDVFWHLRYRNELIIVFYVTGPLGNIAATYGSRGNSRANSRTGSKENLCEDCVQNPLDLVDASIQVKIRYLKSIKFLFYFAWLLSVVQLVYSWNLLRACFTPIKPWACQMLPLLVQCHHCIFWTHCISL